MDPKARIPVQVFYLESARRVGVVKGGMVERRAAFSPPPEGTKESKVKATSWRWVGPAPCTSGSAYTAREISVVL